MKSLDSSIYDKEYYLSQCLGSNEYLSTNGSRLHPRLERLLKLLPVKRNFKVLDIGCGRGDITISIAKKCKEITGIDYSKDAIVIANITKKNAERPLQKKVTFLQMDAKKLEFPDNYFDLVVSIDVFEHLYKDELAIAMKEIKRVVKKNGYLFVDTNTNKWLYDYTYRFYIRPINFLITQVDMLIRHVNYKPMPKDPRITAEKIQHVNEPTFFYLKNLFKENSFVGKISVEIGYLKTGRSVRTKLYNLLTTLYPISLIFPLNLFFAWSFICIMRNKK